MSELLHIRSNIFKMMNRKEDIQHTIWYNKIKQLEADNETGNEGMINNYAIFQEALAKIK